MALLFGIMGYNVELTGLDGFNSINNMLFTTVLIMLLMPYVGISLYTADKTMYIADASARRYRASAYYVAKVGSGLALGLWDLSRFWVLLWWSQALHGWHRSRCARNSSASSPPSNAVDRVKHAVLWHAVILQVLSNLPFNILVTVLYSGIFYGMCGLRAGSVHFAKFACIVTLLQIISAQVRHSDGQVMQ